METIVFGVVFYCLKSAQKYATSCQAEANNSLRGGILQKNLNQRRRPTVHCSANSGNVRTAISEAAMMSRMSIEGSVKKNETIGRGGIIYAGIKSNIICPKLTFFPFKFQIFPGLFFC
jgi:hypothetical protein